MAFLFKRKSKEKKEDRIERGLHKTKENFGQKILTLFSKKQASDDFYDEVEEALVMADVGVETTLEIIDNFKDYLKNDKKSNTDGLKSYFKQALLDMIPQNPFDFKENQLNVLFILGVNGVGKTTSIGKLAHQFKEEGKNVMLAACDTFRAAAIDQLSEWGNRVDVPIIKQQMGSDPGAVLHDAVDSAIANNIDILLVDTAGRFHNRNNLMDEIEKLYRILNKKADKAYKETLLVLDAGTGQNAFVQADVFNQRIKLDGIVLTKLDSTSKGGIVISIAHRLNLPVKFVGIGEKIDDLIPFEKEDYVHSLF